MPDYPKFFSTHVGLNAGAMKSLNHADMKALCEAFRRLTGMDPLGADPVATMWERHKDMTDAPTR